MRSISLFLTCAVLLSPGSNSAQEPKKEDGVKKLTIVDYRKALELFDGGKYHANISFTKKQSVENLINIGDLTGRDSPLATEGVVKGLDETIQRLRKHSKDLEYIFLFLEKTPAMTSVKQRIGDESKTEAGGFYISSNGQSGPKIEKDKLKGANPLTWHKYEWVDFGVVDGKVVVQRIDLRTYPSKSD
jgi:hypothetical protein